MELAPELEIVLAADIRDVVICRLGGLIHQLVGEGCTRAQLGKALCAFANIHNRESAHRGTADSLRKRNQAGHNSPGLPAGCILRCNPSSRTGSIQTVLRSPSRNAD